MFGPDIMTLPRLTGRDVTHTSIGLSCFFPLDGNGLKYYAAVLVFIFEFGVSKNWKILRWGGGIVDG